MINKNWYKQIKELEPDLDLILKDVFEFKQETFKFANHWEMKF
jgi:hypothetical protein